MAENSTGGSLRLACDALGIYSTFLLWALVQERMGTTAYPDPSSPTAAPRFFRSAVFLNTVQSAISCISALGYLSYKWKRGQTIWQVLGLQGETANGHAQKSQPRQVNAKALLARTFQCSLLHSLGSPIAFASLRHIDYPTMILGKSCKLIPVMIMNVFVYRRRFALHKYAVVSMVTIGIAVFTLNQPTSSKKSGPTNSSTLGLGLLFLSLVIDGLTNSSQDEIFTKFPVSGSQMMLLMNLFSTLITLASLIIPFPSIPLLGIASSGTSELSTALSFITSHPAVLKDILLYSACGALGQLFIFDTLEHFGSLTLVTLTVTRKLFTMVLSVVVYNHSLTFGQWVGVGMVFLAIGIEAQYKRKGGLSKKVVEHEKDKARLKAL